MSDSRQTRRDFLRTATAAASAATLSAHSSAQEDSGAPSRPNVLFVFSDQHRACTFPGEPFSNQIAPNMERLASEGIRMDRCISNYPVCSPYRAILLSGRWPTQSGMIDNNAVQLGADEYTIGEAFHDAGYHTSYIGKWHLGNGRNGKPFGYESFRTWSKTNDHMNSVELSGSKTIQRPGYNATGMTDDALEFLDSEHGGKPWLLMLSWNPPHSNFYDAPDWARETLDPADIPLRPNHKGLPSELAKLAGDNRGRKMLHGYQSHITAIDRELGRLLKKLEEPGFENTIIIYTSDHGEMGGSQALGGKRQPYDESCRVPFLARWAGRIPAEASDDGLFQTIDIYPTLCGLAGLEVPSHCVGRDMSAALLGQPYERSETAYLMHMLSVRPSQLKFLFRGVRTETHTYAADKNGHWLLYDDREDPYQLDNLVNDTERRGLRDDLEGVVRDYLKQTNDDFAMPASG